MGSGRYVDTGFQWKHTADGPQSVWPLCQIYTHSVNMPDTSHKQPNLPSAFSIPEPLESAEMYRILPLPGGLGWGQGDPCYLLGPI